MSNIIEASQLPEQDKVYLKKDYFGWRVVQPWKNQDGSINWINLLIGGWRNFAFLLIILALISFLMYSHSHDVKAIEKKYESISSDPLAYCKNVCNDPASAYTDLSNFDYEQG